MTTTVDGEYSPKETVDFIELNLYWIRRIYIFIRPNTCTAARSRANIADRKID